MPLKREWLGVRGGVQNNREIPMQLGAEAVGRGVVRGQHHPLDQRVQELGSLGAQLSASSAVKLRMNSATSSGVSIRSLRPLKILASIRSRVIVLPLSQVPFCRCAAQP